MIFLEHCNLDFFLESKQRSSVIYGVLKILEQNLNAYRLKDINVDCKTPDCKGHAIPELVFGGEERSESSCRHLVFNRYLINRKVISNDFKWQLIIAI